MTTIAVIGLGYVGLPLAVEFGKKFKTIGFDLSTEKIASYCDCIDPTDEVSSEDLRAATKLKQHLRIKQFLGRSKDAVHIQILTALMSYLLLAIHRAANQISASLWQLLGEVRATLFQRPVLDAELYRRRRERMREIAARQARLFA